MQDDLHTSSHVRLRRKFDGPDSDQLHPVSRMHAPLEDDIINPRRMREGYGS